MMCATAEVLQPKCLSGAAMRWATRSLDACAKHSTANRPGVPALPCTAGASGAVAFPGHPPGGSGPPRRRRGTPGWRSCRGQGAGEAGGGCGAAGGG